MVKTEQLRELQAPIKARYRDDPGRAVITLRAAGDLDSEAVSCSVQTGEALVEAGLHPASGGDGSLACSGDMLLEALDFRGTIGVAKDAPVGFREIRLRFVLESSATEDDLDALLAATERYCVVYQTLISAVTVG